MSEDTLDGFKVGDVVYLPPCVVQEYVHMGTTPTEPLPDSNYPMWWNDELESKEIRGVVGRVMKVYLDVKYQDMVILTPIGDILVRPSMVSRPAVEHAPDEIMAEYIIWRLRDEDHV